MTGNKLKIPFIGSVRSEGWHFANPTDLPAVREFLSARESWTCTCSDKVRAALSAKDISTFERICIALHSSAQAGTLDALVYFSTGGMAFPVLDDSMADNSTAFQVLAQSKALQVAGYSEPPFSCIGRSADSRRLEAAFAWQPALSIEYYAMSQVQPLGLQVPVPEGLSVRPARRQDLEALLPLAAAYDKEEVLTVLHQYNAAATKAAQRISLIKYKVYVAEYKGRLVGRAQTNAEGFTREQIGGVYVQPEFRGRGIGRLLMSALLQEINCHGRLASLFVKKHNTAAQRLYGSLGFQSVADYSIDYFV
ncbi:MAG: GNAT family N-acetyltransferase [Spirochaetes bacterium]|nr:GNAT family N-acetyltransferase [Spirochaetota bacterium]MBU0956057.1 GNAT family N-acetyltransferase [Spirochaetota bacterium]